MKTFAVLFWIATAVAATGMVALYGASLRDRLMGNYEQVMRDARAAVSEFSPLDPGE